MTDNRTTELLPCPICGGQPDFQRFNITPNVQGRIICACGIELRQGKNDTEDDMRVIWNTRADYAVQAENERKVEQTIAATLGSGTCELTEVEIDCGSASEWMLDRFFVFDSVYKCSCGETYGYVARNRPNYCPNCGKAVTR